MKTINIHLKKAKENIPFKNTAAAGQALTFAAGFVLANANVAGGISPFAPAFAASVHGSKSISALLGGCCGCLINFDGTFSARLIALTICTGLINYCLYRMACVRNNRTTAPVSSAGACMLTGIAVLVTQGFTANGFITYLCESILCGGSACFLSRLTFPSGFFSGKTKPDTAQLSGILVFFCMLIISAEQFKLGDICLSHIAAVVIILICARLTGITGGCISGGAMAFALCIGSAEPAFAGVCTFGGITAGLLYKKSKVLQCFAFGAICTAVIFTNDKIYELIPMAYEVILALVIFAAIPKKFFKTNAVFFTTEETLPEFEAMKKALLLRLENVSGGLDEISLTVDRIAAEMVKLEKLEYTDTADETKHLVRDQFSTLSTAVREIAQTFAKETRFDTQISAKISSVLTGYGITPRQVVCAQTGEQTRIDICAEKINSKISRSALIDDMETACGCRLCIPSVTEAENATLITFEKKPKYNLRIGTAQHTAEGKLCGDSFDTFSDTDGNTVVIISDGMGTGPKAAVDGTVAAWLFSKLIAAGLGFESALRLSNSALIVKSAEETLATIDAARINLHTGKTDFFKAGAGISFVCKGKKVCRIGQPSLPLGILREVEFSKDSTVLKRGDRLLMMSDGVPQAAYEEIAENLRSYNKNDPSALAEKVVETAEKHSVLKHPDDITAIAVIVG